MQHFSDRAWLAKATSYGARPAVVFFSRKLEMTKGQDRSISALEMGEGVRGVCSASFSAMAAFCGKLVKTLEKVT